MPASIFSHQAPALLIKIKYPKKLDGTALCLSTMVPDFYLIFYPFLPFSLRGITHSLLGLFIYNVPLTIILTILFCKYIAPFFSKIAKNNGFLSKPLKYFGVDDWDNLREKQYNSRFFLVAFYSALIGGLTHLLLDLPAHETIELFFPIILQSPDFLLFSLFDFSIIIINQRQFSYSLTIYNIIWNIETIILFISALYLLRYIKKHNLISEWYRTRIQKEYI